MEFLLTCLKDSQPKVCYEELLQSSLYHVRGEAQEQMSTEERTKVAHTVSGAREGLPPKPWVGGFTPVEASPLREEDICQ